MLLDFLPDIPGRKFDKPYKFLGYWHAIGLEPESGLPQIPSEFIEAQFDRYQATCGEGVLPFPWDFVDTTWDEAQRAAVVTYLKTGETFESWRGSSWCRFKWRVSPPEEEPPRYIGCDVPHLSGYRDFTDGTYVWPEAFFHYVEKHGVKPPNEFIQHVLKRMYL